MKYKLFFTQRARKRLNKLPLQHKKQILKKLLSLLDNPYRSFKKLEGLDKYSLRVIHYRIIAEIVREEIVIIITLGDRKNIYPEVNKK